MFYIELFIYYIAIINAITFIVYGIDKYKAYANGKGVKNKKWRIPESSLLILAALGGSIGAWLGMMLFRHKTRHLKFSLGVPLIFILQFALLVYTYVRF